MMGWMEGLDEAGRDSIPVLDVCGNPSNVSGVKKLWSYEWIIIITIRKYTIGYRQPPHRSRA